MAPETPNKAPEQNNIPKEQFVQIMATMQRLADDFKKYDIKGNWDGQYHIEHTKGSFQYRMNLSSRGRDARNGGISQSLSVSKDKKSTFGREEYLGTLDINVNEIGKNWEIKMTFQPNIGGVPGQPEEIARVKFEDGKYSSQNGDLLAEKANEFLEIYTNYVNANKPQTSGPKEVREF